MVKLRYSTLDFQSSIEFNCPQKKKKKTNNNNNIITTLFVFLLVNSSMQPMLLRNLMYCSYESNLFSFYANYELLESNIG